MASLGLLVNFNYCCGCHTCEVACQKEHGYAVGQSGIMLSQTGPFVIEGTKQTVFDFLPVPTDLCDLCSGRRKRGELPSCVKHCQTRCIAIGAIEDLAALAAEEEKTAVFVPRSGIERECEGER